MEEIKMAGKDFELDRLSGIMDSAQRDIDNLKPRLDALSSKREFLKGQICEYKYRIDDLKRDIDMEYSMMKSCYQARDRYSAENHKYNAQSYKEALQREYSYKNSIHEQLNCLKSEFDSVLSSFRSAKERKQNAREAFNRRLQEVRAIKEIEKAKWKEKPCKKCGQMIRYHIEWSHIPTYCKDCKSRYSGR